MKNKSLLSRLLDNKKVVLVISLVLSLIFWIASSDNIAKTIRDVPLSYSLSENLSSELKVFDSNVNSVTVSVTGKRVAVDALSAEDFSAYVDLSDITEPVTGSFPVLLDNSKSVSFDIDKIEPSNVTLTIDREAKKTVKLICDFTYSPDNFYVEHNAPENIEITGPESVVSKIQSAYIGGNVNSPNAAPVTNTYSVKLYDNEDITSPEAQEVSKDLLTLSYSDLDVSFRFLQIEDDMPFSVKYLPSSVKLPSDYYTITPSTLSVAGPEALITGDNAMTTIPIDIGSLSQYKNEIYNLRVNVDDILSTELVNKSDGVDSVKIQLDFSSLSTETFDVPSSRIKVLNVPEGYLYDAPTTFAVTVVGTQSAIGNLTENDFTITYDFTDVVPAADTYVNVPVTINFNSSGISWVYRSSDTASVLLRSAT
ncbi:MAG: YbbR-like domain-containing protein [Ruminococcus sp.]